MYQIVIHLTKAVDLLRQRKTVESDHLIEEENNTAASCASVK